jgi:hypothetical protein
VSVKLKEIRRQVGRRSELPPNFQVHIRGICPGVPSIRGKAIELEPRPPTSSDTGTHSHVGVWCLHTVHAPILAATAASGGPRASGQFATHR